VRERDKESNKVVGMRRRWKKVGWNGKQEEREKESPMGLGGIWERRGWKEGEINRKMKVRLDGGKSRKSEGDEWTDRSKENPRKGLMKGRNLQEEADRRKENPRKWLMEGRKPPGRG
jgi:hypothetical protein